MSVDLGAAAMRGRRTGLDVRWMLSSDGVARAAWCPIGCEAFGFDVRRVCGRWLATVERVHPHLLRRAAGFDTRDEGQLWCEETAWTIRCEEMER